MPYLTVDPDDNFLGNWEEDEFSFLFFSRQSDDIVNKLLSTVPELHLIDTYNMTYEAWHGNKITSFRVGRFLIVPSWEKEMSLEIKPGDVRILLDPGVVFGTGTHPTTNHCLDALVTLWYNNRIESIVDLGTGTGLLAIAATKLGCSRTLAVDFNFLAARTALNNVKLNGLENNVLVVHGLAEELMDKSADLMISNIHYNVMKNLIETKAFLNFRYFILSGLLRTEARNVADQLKRLPVEILKTWDEDNIWHTFLGKINNP